MKILVMLFLGIPVILSGQRLSVDFENNDFSSWYQDYEGHWEISSEQPISGKLSLHHAFDNDQPGADWIAFYHDPLQLRNVSASWQFSLKYLYTPSSQNHWAVALINEMPSKGFEFQKGIILGVDYRGNDDLIKVWEKSSDQVTEICSTDFNWQNSVKPGQVVRFLLEHKENGVFNLSIDTTGNTFFLIGSFQYDDLDQMSFFALDYVYTATRDRGLYFDDLMIQGDFNPDTISPLVTEIQHIHSNRFDIRFNEYVRLPDEPKCCVDGIGCGSLSENGGKIFKVNLPYSMIPGHLYNLHLPAAADLNGNVIRASDQEKNLYYPPAYSVLITEIMADPTPPVGLPEAEYIEITNVSDFDINIDSWKVRVNNREINLPDTIIGSHKSAIICDAEFKNEFEKNIAVIGVRNFPAINNDEALIILTDQSGRLIHSVDYSSALFNSSVKKDGGWSLEMTDLSAPCILKGNWEESTDPRGGTPGTVNTVLKEISLSHFPEIWRAAISDTGSLVLYFSEPMDSLSLVNTALYTANNGIGNPRKVFPTWPLAQNCALKFSRPFSEDVVYKLSVTSDPCNCSGNKIFSGNDISFGIPKKPGKEDIVINEVMYEPADGREEYLELFNRSDKILDLHNMKLRVGEKQDRIITTDYFPLLPGSYAVIASELKGIDSPQAFKRGNLVVQMPDLPVLSNNGGRISLLDSVDNIIDEINYSPDFQNEILQNTKGVALERISPDRSGLDADNWQSAASDVNYQTPGGPNSQLFAESSNYEINLQPESITPNSDGIDDNLIIHYSMDHPGYMARVFVFDPDGRKIATVCNGALLGMSGDLIFNGRGDNGILPSTGYYILYFQAYDKNGHKFESRKTFVLVNEK